MDEIKPTKRGFSAKNDSLRREAIIDRMHSRGSLQEVYISMAFLLGGKKNSQYINKKEKSFGQNNYILNSPHVNMSQE